MKILVTGSEGTIGKHLCSFLRTKKFDVFRTDRIPGTNEDYARADVSEYRQLESVINKFGPDVIYHLAAECGRLSGEIFYETMWKTNAVGTKHLLNLQRKYHFRMIFFSTSEVYGDYKDLMTEGLLDEGAPIQLNDYGMTKWVGEMQCVNAAREWGNQIVRVRPFNFYGPGEDPNEFRSVQIRWLYSAARNEEIIIHRSYSRSMIYADDFIEMVSRIVEPEKWRAGEAYNIGNPSVYTMEEIADLVCDITGLSKSKLKYSDRPPIETTKHKKVDVSKMLKDLGNINFTDIKTGFIKTLRWMTESKIIGNGPWMND